MNYVYVVAPSVAFGLLAVAGVLYGIDQHKKRLNYPYEKADELRRLSVQEGVLQAQCDGLEQDMKRLKDQANEIAAKLLKTEVERDDLKTQVAKLDADNEMYAAEIVKMHEQIKTLNAENVTLMHKLGKAADHATQPLKPKRTSRGKAASKNELVDNQIA